MMPMQGSMSIERMCQLAEVSRAGSSAGRYGADQRYNPE
jgi:hypothetical protein